MPFDNLHSNKKIAEIKSISSTHKYTTLVILLSQINSTNPYSYESTFIKFHLKAISHLSKSFLLWFEFANIKLKT